MDPKKGDNVPVIYVHKKDAKRMKTYLEAKGLLHKDYRMTPSSETDNYSHCIAIPVRETISLDEIEFSDPSCPIIQIQGKGNHFCPYSTACLGNPNRSAPTPFSTDREPLGGTDAQTQAQRLRRFSLAQKALWNVSLQLCHHPPLPVLAEGWLERIASFPVTICPKQFEFLGDDRTLVISQSALNPEQSETLSEWMLDVCGQTKTHLKDDDEEAPITMNTFLSLLWAELAHLYHSPRVVRRGGVDPNSGIRESGYHILWSSITTTTTTSNGHSYPSSSWITVTEQGIRQSFDLERVMFSRGNITEKMRFGGQLVQPGEVVLDLYAGIGYFTLPALVHGRAAHVYACEWNPHAVQALHYNLRDNGVQDRATVVVGDCRVTAVEHGLIHICDRVSLGLLPSSEGGWRTAVRALKPDSGGWLHVHGNVPVQEMETWSRWLCVRLNDVARAEHAVVSWVVVLTHVEKVKSFAPTVNHYVADVVLGPPECVRKWIHTKEDHPLTPGVAYLLKKEDDSLEACPESIQPPSCTLSESGVLHQAWMREDHKHT